MVRTAASQKGAVGAAGEENRALPARFGLDSGAARVDLGLAGPERSAVLSQRA
jgi:hypothetical protein